MVGNSLHSGVIEAPILLLGKFHKALRAEFDGIYQTISSYFDVDFGLEQVRRGLVVDLQHRFHFLKLAYHYHSTAEDEIIFQALDARVANVACTYHLEHNDIDDLFESVFQSLNVLLEKDENCFDYSKRFQELVDSTSTIQTSIFQHMFKEEEQIFPLLVHHFSFREQASLVWQFFSSVPIILLEDFLPWMMSYLPEDEQADVVHCIKEIVPKDKILQEVVASWLGKRNQRSPISFNSINDEATLNSYNSFYVKKVHRTYISWSSSYKKSCIQIEFDCLEDNARSNLVESLCIWHGAIIKYLKEVLNELYDIRTSKDFSNVSSIGGQLKFLADVLTFYSDALENVLFPMIRESSKRCLSFSNKRFPNANRISLLRVLQNIDIHNGTSLCKIVDDLFQQLEALLEEISKNFTFQELEVFPLIRKHCNYNMQKKLLYLSLHIMPLGLLKCVITWLLAHLNEDESKAAILDIQLAGSELDMSFASLLYDWVCVGRSKKVSHGMFKRELQVMFSNKSYYLAKNIERAELVDLNSFPLGRFLPDRLKSTSSDKAKKGALVSSTQNIKPKIYFPEIFKKVSPFSQYLADKGDVGSSLKPEFKPIDYMFLFHKALSNDLNYLVHESTKLVEDITLFENFRQRFDLVRFLCQIHSENEDKFAFPALETKGQLQNISLSYTMDHKLETECFSQISIILDKISKLHASLPSKLSLVKDQRILKYRHLCMKLHGKCKTICITLGKHFQREEIELWPLFTEYFTDEDQDKIIGGILGNTRPEILQQMIPWLMASLSPGEQHAMMSLWRKATKNTMFEEWLAEWWEGMTISNTVSVEEESTILPWVVDPLEIVATYLSKERHCHIHGSDLPHGDVRFQQEVAVDDDFKLHENSDGDDQTKHPIIQMYPEAKQFSGSDELQRKCCDHLNNEVTTLTVQVSKQGEHLSATQKLRHLEDHVSKMNEEDFEGAIIRICHDTSLDADKKTSICQLLRTSRWTVSQQKSDEEVILSSNDGEVSGQFPSYRDPSTFGCKHYKRNCKVLAACCEKLFTCRYCHDEATDHLMDRKSTTKMMCMKCLKVQPIAATCSTISCNDLSMGKYFCDICRLYDDEREIYHCPYCNLCRLGKGLGIDFFHCMRCNACLNQSLAVHVCREKGFESNCPICHEDIFSSSSPVKALPCGHMMHSTCFQDYTCMHYTCPICSKSLGDMTVYFRMLDAYLAEAKIPEELHGQTQGILCNDCEKRGTAPFHWHHHKCSICGSYNTRLL